MAGLRLGAAGVPGAGRSAEHDHGPRQGPFHLDRLAEQGRLRAADSAQVAGPDLPPPKVAAPDPDVEERGAIPGPGADGDQHDGLQDGPSAACEGERRGPVSAGLDEEPGPRPFHRRGRRRDPVCVVPAMRRSADARRDYVARFCNRLELDMDVQRKAKEILDKVEKDELASGVAPSGVAAATIYIAAILCNKPCTQKEVAEVAGVTEVTIRNRYKRISVAIGMVK